MYDQTLFMNNLAPLLTFVTFWKYTDQVVLFDLGMNEKLKVLRIHLKTYGDRAFAYQAPVLWNTLPVDFQCAQSLDSLKCKLKSFLFRK